MKKQRRGRKVSLALLIVVAAAYLAWTLLRPLPYIQPVQSRQTWPIRTAAGKLDWPAQGQAAASLLGTDYTVAHGAQTPVPTASTAKVVTALVVLQKKPLAPGQSGPTVTLTPADVDIYNRYVALDGSVLPIQANEQLSEYQMLQALMLPSANNIADTMAIWAYGSLPAYAAAANAFLAQHGLVHTHIGSDASGLSPDTTSTAQDLVAIGKLAMQNLVLSQIVGQNTAAGFPIVNTIHNVNGLLGSNGVVGIKTGNSDRAGGAFLGAAKTTYQGKTVTVITAVMSAPDLFSALRFTVPLIQSAQRNFALDKILPTHSVVGHYTAPWGVERPAISRLPLNATVWQGDTVKVTTTLQPIKPQASARDVGSVRLPRTPVSDAQTVPVDLEGIMPPPSIWWRLTHPL